MTLLFQMNLGMAWNGLQSDVISGPFRIEAAKVFAPGHEAGRAASKFENGRTFTQGIDAGLVLQNEEQ